MLNRQLPEIMSSIYKCMDVKGEKFAYALLKNKNKIEPKYELLKERFKKLEDEIAPIPEYDEYDKKRVELAKKHSRKNEDGSVKIKIHPQFQTEQYDIIDVKKFEDELNVLKEEYKDAIEKKEEQEKELNSEKDKIFDEEVEIEIHMVSKVPEGISARELEAAKFMIK